MCFWYPEILNLFEEYETMLKPEIKNMLSGFQQ